MKYVCTFESISMLDVTMLKISFDSPVQNPLKTVSTTSTRRIYIDIGAMNVLILNRPCMYRGRVGVFVVVVQNANPQKNASDGQLLLCTCMTIT